MFSPSVFIVKSVGYFFLDVLYAVHLNVRRHAHRRQTMWPHEKCMCVLFRTAFPVSARAVNPPAVFICDPRRSV